MVILVGLLLPAWLNAETGYDAWLRYAPVEEPAARPLPRCAALGFGGLWHRCARAEREDGTRAWRTRHAQS
jgi:hypothetical protein